MCTICIVEHDTVKKHQGRSLRGVLYARFLMLNVFEWQTEWATGQGSNQERCEYIIRYMVKTDLCFMYPAGNHPAGKFGYTSNLVFLQCQTVKYFLFPFGLVCTYVRCSKVLQLYTLPLCFYYSRGPRVAKCNAPTSGTQKMINIQAVSNCLYLL